MDQERPLPLHKSLSLVSSQEQAKPAYNFPSCNQPRGLVVRVSDY